MDDIIFYFTGTGNSLKIAKTISKELDNVEIVSMNKLEKCNLTKQYDTIGFVYSVYYWGIHEEHSLDSLRHILPAMALISKPLFGLSNRRKQPERYMKDTTLSVVFFILLCSLFVSCSKSQAPSTKPVIAVSILPHAWFVERIARAAESGGGADAALVDIMVLAGPGQNPHTFEPSPKQMEELARAKVWILSGAEFEISLRPKIERLFKNLTIVDGTLGARFRTLEADETGAGDEGDGIDRHTWLGREPAKILAAHIRDQLSILDKDNAARYDRNYRELAADIDAEFASLREELAPLSGQPVFVYHPAFGYFLDEFNIRQEAVEAGGKEPGPRTLNELIEKAGQEKPAAIFVQAQFPAATAKTIADATGADVVVLDPLARDWLKNIRVMGEALKRSARAYDTSLK